MTTRQLTQQVTDIIMGDSNLIKVIAEAVSSLIVEKIAGSDEIIEKVSNSIAEQPNFMNSITTKLQAESHRLYDELQAKNSELELRIDELEQYSRRNCLVLHGIVESQYAKENTDDLVLEIVRKKLDLEISATDLDRSHRIGRGRNTSYAEAASEKRKKPRPIIVKFVSYKVRAEVFRRKRKLKGSGVRITESLTKKRMELYNSVLNDSNVKTAWTLDGRIIALKNDERKVSLESFNDLYKL